jgi:hypothetical protein
MHCNFSLLTAPQADFVTRVCEHLRVNFDEAQIAVYGDGSASPNGEKFAATRIGHAAWNIVFDFGTSECFHTHVQLPAEWREMGRLNRSRRELVRSAKQAWTDKGYSPVWIEQRLRAAGVDSNALMAAWIEELAEGRA